MFAIRSFSICDTEEDILLSSFNNGLDREDIRYHEERLYKNVDGLIYLYIYVGGLASSNYIGRGESEDIILLDGEEAKLWLLAHGKFEKLTDLLNAVDN